MATNETLFLIIR